MQTDYDIAIIGGGLAGLATSIQLQQQGYRVVLFEKEAYPFHRVCGEYVSLESQPFLSALGIDIGALQLPVIDTLKLTAPNGKYLTARLPLGGFGISRFLLDNSLANIASASGVTIFQRTKVEDVLVDQCYHVRFSGKTVSARVVCGAFGKRSNLDVRWNRPFIHQQSDRLNNYVGVKYHIRTDWPANMIGLHNFKNGYCGISKIEEDKHCLCYMTKAENLKACKGNISQMQEQVLYQNPHLKAIFSNGEVVQSFPVTVSQISFSQKEKVERGMLMLGDAAGMITPLCGNGMSIALHTSKIAATVIGQFLKNELTEDQLVRQYQLQWQQHFASRLRTGRMLQSFFGSHSLSNLLVGTVRLFPFLARPLIRMTHGKPF
jgi:menaquinone-9 beta-reductase